MSRTRVIRFLAHTGTVYKKFYAEEERLRAIREQQMRDAREKEKKEKQRAMARQPHSKIPLILALHKQLNNARREINELRITHPNSHKLTSLEKKYHAIDEMLMRKLKEE